MMINNLDILVPGIGIRIPSVPLGHLVSTFTSGIMKTTLFAGAALLGFALADFPVAPIITGTTDFTSNSTESAVPAGQTSLSSCTVEPVADPPAALVCGSVGTILQIDVVPINIR